MDNETREKIGSAAGQFVQQAMELGLTWDEAVAAFGLAAKAAAHAAASTSDDTNENCVAIARQRLDDAFATDVRVVVTIADSEHVGDDVQDNPLLATAHRRHGGRLH
jgi:Na+/alanine symporter